MENELMRITPKLGFWLQLFRIYLLIIVGILPFYAVVSFLGYIFLNMEIDIEPFLDVSYYISFLFSIYILKILKNNDPQVPNVIMACIAWEMILSCLLLPNGMEMVVGYMAYYYISYYYFKKSKKVKEYYGGNSLEVLCKDIPLLYPNFRG